MDYPTSFWFENKIKRMSFSFIISWEDKDLFVCNEEIQFCNFTNINDYDCNYLKIKWSKLKPYDCFWMENWRAYVCIWVNEDNIVVCQHITIVAWFDTIWYHFFSWEETVYKAI